MSNRIVNFNGDDFNYSQLEIMYGLDKGSLKSARKTRNGINLIYTNQYGGNGHGFISSVDIELKKHIVL